MHDYCDLYLKILDDVDLLFAQYGGSDLYVRKQNTVRDPSDAVKCALNAISAAIRLSRKDCRDLSSQLVQVFTGIRSACSKEEPEPLRKMRMYTALDALYSALECLVPLISGGKTGLFDGVSTHVLRSRIVGHMEEAVSYIASAASDIQNGVCRNPKETKGDENYYRHASRAVFTCVSSLLEGHVSSASTCGHNPLSFSGIKAAIKLVLLVGDATPNKHVGTAARMSVIQFEHCIKQLAKVPRLEEGPPDEHHIALSALKFAINAYASSRGVSSILQEEDSVWPQCFVNFHLLEASSYVDYITAKSGVYAYVLDAYEEEHENQGIVTKVYDCSGEICDLQGAFDKIDALINGMLGATSGGSSGPFYSSPTVRKALKRIADNIAALLTMICTWAEAWHMLQGEQPSSAKDCDPRAIELHDVLQESRKDFVVSVGRALEFFTICVCRLDDVYYSRSMFPLVTAWDPSSLPVFPGEYTRSWREDGLEKLMRGAQGVSTADCGVSTDKVQGKVGEKIMRVLENLREAGSSSIEAREGFVVALKKPANGKSKPASGVESLVATFNGFFSGGKAPRSYAPGYSPPESSTTTMGRGRCGNDNVSAASEGESEPSSRPVKASSDPMIRELVQKLHERGQQQQQQLSLGGSSPSTSGSNHLTVPVQNYGGKKPRKAHSSQEHCTKITVTESTGRNEDTQALPSTRLGGVSSCTTPFMCLLTRGGGM